jgi:hypothetical protein
MVEVEIEVEIERGIMAVRDAILRGENANALLQVRRRAAAMKGNRLFIVIDFIMLLL